MPFAKTPLRSDPSLVAVHRPERELATRWGIYSSQEKKWIDVFFASKAEAETAIAVLNRAGASPASR